MAPAPFGFICGFFWFGSFLLAQLAIFWYEPAVRRSRVLGNGIAMTIAAATITVALAANSDGTAILAETYAVMTIACLFVLYGPFFYTIHTSLSIESIILLAQQAGRARQSALIERFASRTLLDARLRTMVDSGYLIQRGEIFVLTPRARRIAHAFGAVKSLWRLGPGG